MWYFEKKKVENTGDTNRPTISEKLGIDREDARLEYIPEVGDGATLYGWSDSDAATVIEVKKSGRVVIQEDKATLIDGSTGTERQVYRYEPNPEGNKYTCFKDKRGRWKVIGDGKTVGLGHRRTYRDPTF